MKRVVFDTNIVVSALLFLNGRLAWLRDHWRSSECTALVSHPTVAELQRVLRYQKFHVEPEELIDLLGDYLPYCEIVEEISICPQTCRDHRDQPFLDLAFTARADVLVTGDKDLLALADWTPFAIESPESYRRTCGK